MCVCDLGGVYIKPTRPWVVVPLPSSLATIERRRPASCRPVVVVSSAVLSCPVVSCRPVVIVIVWRPVLPAVAVCRLASVVWPVVYGAVLSSAVVFAPSFCAIPFPLFAHQKSISLREISVLISTVLKLAFWFGKFNETLKKRQGFSFI